jgi:hypothetical protein
MFNLNCNNSYGLVLWGAFSDERTSLAFVYAAGPCQHSLSRVRVPWDSRPYFTVSDLKIAFSSPPTTRRVTVGLFDPASTRVFSRLLCQSESESHIATDDQSISQSWCRAPMWGSWPHIYCCLTVTVLLLWAPSLTTVIACISKSFVIT